ncbi:hypothetical protein LPN04_31330 [Rugamonas sp. A1-17]|nr:hypothetical protein [Rugamonas sp. A1-17]
MSTIHLVLTGKGGVGKSYISTILAQYLPPDTFCGDTDPSNPTFTSYKAIGARHFNIMTDDMNIDKSRFDALMDIMLEHEGDCLVDNGSSSFLPMMAYILENNVIDFLQEAGKTVVIHSVLIGGLGLEETTRGVSSLLQSQVAPIVIWENELYGPVEMNGMRFADTDAYSKHKERILGIVRIAARGADTYGKDLHRMTSQKLTFDEVDQSTEFGAFNKQRMRTVRRDIFKQLDQLDFSAR